MKKIICFFKRHHMWEGIRKHIVCLRCGKTEKLHKGAA